MNKTIIHAKMPIDEKGNYLIKLDYADWYLKSIRNYLGEEYILVTSPFEINKIVGDAPFISIDLKGYTYNELIEIIRKAEEYDKEKSIK